MVFHQYFCYTFCQKGPSEKKDYLKRHRALRARARREIFRYIFFRYRCQNILKRPHVTQDPIRRAASLRFNIDFKQFSNLLKKTIVIGSVQGSSASSRVEFLRVEASFCSDESPDEHRAPFRSRVSEASRLQTRGGAICK